MRIFRHILLYGVVIVYMMCTICCSSESVTESDNLVARVGPYTLSKERVMQPYLRASLKNDSLTTITKFIDQWAHDKAFEIEALEKLESREELDNLIEAYRSSLLTHLFEKQIIEQHLDSTISQQDLQTYYDDNKSQYVLQSSIVRLHFINVRKDHPDVDDIASLWKNYDQSASLDSLIDLCHASAEVFLLEDSSWYRIEDLASIVPGNILKNRSNTLFTEQTFSNDTAKYFLRILESIPDTEIAPLSFIEKQARKVILYRRKQKLIGAWREQIYEDALKANRIKLY